ncbi:GMP synthase [Candidatus Riesia sp. GBBU]|nr:GMP synthase [Candidatus Riesia sp. GBBU]
MKTFSKKQILIVDFGSQYSQLIARRVREVGVYCKIIPWNINKIKIKNLKPNGIILSGGPDSTINRNSPRVQKIIFNMNVPILGICYGMQIMSIQLGGNVVQSSFREFGFSKVYVHETCVLLDDIYDSVDEEGTHVLDVWMSHGDTVSVIPKDFKLIASTKNCKFAIIENKKRNFYGVQFHPEVTHTKQGLRILKRFVIKVCKCKTNWTPSNILKNITENIRTIVGKDEVILAISGGIDSLVTAIILNRAIGKKLICIFVDNGLLRENESSDVTKFLNEKMNLYVRKIVAKSRFFNALSGVSDPETKRKIIGKLFFEIFNEQAKKNKKIKWLAQGTICSDVIESAKIKYNRASLIKSHHNVGGLPKNIKIKLIEPLRRLFKDEVKKIGFELGLSYEIMNRHPFPGPGLGIRIIGEVKKLYCDLLRKADAIFIDELKKNDLYQKVSQAFAVFIPVRSISVVGDDRKYEWIISLRAVETTDFMTAKWAYLPHKFLSFVSTRIINEVPGISRVVYDISNKPPSTIEWE